MRPVNLIPIEQRHGERAPMRGGPLAYVVIGALVAALSASPCWSHTAIRSLTA